MYSEVVPLKLSLEQLVCNEAGGNFKQAFALRTQPFRGWLNKII